MRSLILAFLLMQTVHRSDPVSTEFGGGGLPSGVIVYLDTDGACPSGYTEVTALAGKMVLLTTNAANDAGTTGGSDTITPAGNVAAPAVSWPAGVPTASGAAVSAHAGTAVADHASHTHTYTQVPNHVHPYCSQTATTGSAASYEHGAIDTSSAEAECTETTNNPTGGVATGTTNGPGATLTHAVTQPSDHTVTQPTIAWPAGVPTNTAPAFTGTQFDNRSAYVKLIPCRKD